MAGEIILPRPEWPSNPNYPKRPPVENKERLFQGKVAIVTGGTRGIGAEISRVLVKGGAFVIAPHRDAGKNDRVKRFVSELESDPGSIFPFVADIADKTQRDSFFKKVLQMQLKIDYLIHNAAGGLEKWSDSNYPYKINAESKVALSTVFFPILSNKGRIIDIPSLWSKYYGNPQVEQMPLYEPIAESKWRGEQELRSIIPQLNLKHRKDAKLLFVCGHIIEDTITAKMLKRVYPDREENNRKIAFDGKFPQSQDMAFAVSMALSDPNLLNGDTLYVGVDPGYIQRLTGKKPQYKGRNIVLAG